jgi:hypothetical protein
MRFSRWEAGPCFKKGGRNLGRNTKKTTSTLTQPSRVADHHRLCSKLRTWLSVVLFDPVTFGFDFFLAAGGSDRMMTGVNECVWLNQASYIRARLSFLISADSSSRCSTEMSSSYSLRHGSLVLNAFGLFTLGCAGGTIVWIVFYLNWSSLWRIYLFRMAAVCFRGVGYLSSSISSGSGFVFWSLI